jgi:hypothetical protein
MVTKKKTATPEVQEQPEADEVNVGEAFHRGAQIVCGHTNKHFMNAKGQREDLACTLPKGHAGDHFALYKSTITDYGIDKDGRQCVTGSHIVESEGWWSDAAGVLAPPPDVSREEDHRRLQAARAREHTSNGLEADPTLTNKIEQEVIRAYNG